MALEESSSPGLSPEHAQNKSPLSSMSDTHYSQIPRSNLIPPPTASVLLERTTARKTSLPRRKRRDSDQLSALRRMQRSLQHHLQDLLDAQADSLLSGVADAPSEEASTVSTPRSESPFPGARPPRQPDAPKMTLRRARRRIHAAMLDMSRLKSEELECLRGEAATAARHVQQLDAWGRKRAALQAEVAGLEQREGEAELVKLRDEDAAVQEQINALEQQLSELRLQQRAIRGRLSSLQSSLAAEASSFKGSLVMLEREVNEFLRRDPLVAQGGEGTESAFVAVPPERRTVELAKEHYDALQTRAEEASTDAEMELDALMQGAQMWKGLIQDITAFEASMRTEMEKLNPAAHDSNAGIDSGGNDATKGMRHILDLLQNLLTDVESAHARAEENNWSLLICCIGAEMEALRQGQDVLARMLDGSSESAVSKADANSALIETQASDAEDLSTPVDETKKPLDFKKVPSVDGDIEANPQSLLISQDTDTE